MGEMPAPRLDHPAGSSIWTTAMLPFTTAGQAEANTVNFTAGAWPAAARGIWVPFTVDSPCTALKMFWENGAAAGTTDIGIYDLNNNRLVSVAGTTNSGTTVQVADITDTLLVPGLYYGAMASSTVTTQTYWSAVVQIPDLRACGCYQMASGQPLPNPSVPAAISSAYLPFFGIQFRATL